MRCLSCCTGNHYECSEPIEAVDIEDSVLMCCCGSESEQSTVISTVIGGYKENNEVTDPISTGRKRAAQLKPIIEGMTCEWAGLRNAGGGAIPIVGCGGNKLTTAKGNSVLTGNVHHGPDKSTLNNSDENLHRICGGCHNKWHTLNDPLYPQGRPANGEPYLPVATEVIAHDRHTLATPAEILKSLQWWGIDKKSRPEYLTYVFGEEDA